jgi:hypothetical protein
MNVLLVGVYSVLHAKDMPWPQKKAYINLMNACNKVAQKSFNGLGEVGAASALLASSIAEVELHLPCHELDIKLHNLLHLPSQIAAQGPLWTNAMWAYENIYGIIMRYLKNRRFPESNILRAVADTEDTWLATLKSTGLVATDDPDNTELAMSKNFWLPSSMYESHVSITLTKGYSTKLSNISSIKNYPKDQYAMVHHLHLFYMHNIEAYAAIWETFVGAWYSTLSAADKTGVSKGRNGQGMSFTRASVFRKAYDNFRGLILDKSKFPDGLKSNSLNDDAVRYEHVTVGKALFDTCLKHSVLGGDLELLAGSTWIMAKVASDSDLKYIGQLKYIIEHVGPDGKLRKLCCVHGWLQEVHMDMYTNMPVFSKEMLVLKEGNFWPLDQVAAVNFMVVRHYDYNTSTKAWWIALHRDPRFVQAAGFDMDGCSGGSDADE